MKNLPDALLAPFPEKLLSYIFPRHYFLRYHAWPHSGKRSSDKKVIVCVSFDCDNPDDYRFLPDIVKLLTEFSIPASFAVCASIAQRHPDEYRAISAAGHTVINHGYSPHVRVSASGILESCFFYNHLSEKQIRDEIVHADTILTEILGVRPEGFRTPHFGTFEKPSQIALIYRILKDIGYTYDTSTRARTCCQQHLNQNSHGIIEFPLSGSALLPGSVFDSWSFRNSPESFFPVFHKTMTLCMTSPTALLYNFYMDPMHIAGTAGFRDILAELSSLRNRIEITTYTALARKLTMRKDL